jgi:hypothetical protein
MAAAAFLINTSPGPGLCEGATSTLSGVAFASVIQAALLLMLHFAQQLLVMERQRVKPSEAV